MNGRIGKAGKGITKEVEKMWSVHPAETMLTQNELCVGAGGCGPALQGTPALTHRRREFHSHSYTHSLAARLCSPAGAPPTPSQTNGCSKRGRATNLMISSSSGHSYIKDRLQLSYSIGYVKQIITNDTVIIPFSTVK